MEKLTTDEALVLMTLANKDREWTTSALMEATKLQGANLAAAIYELVRKDKIEMVANRVLRIKEEPIPIKKAEPKPKKPKKARRKKAKKADGE